MKQKIQLRIKAKSLEPILRVGKHSLSDKVILELGELLKKRKLVKIKLLKSCLNGNKKELTKMIVDKTESELIEAVGNVVVLYKK